MHEFSIAASIVDVAERCANGRRVTEVDVRVGALRQVVASTLRLAFDIASRETPCAGAGLNLEAVPARLRCAACDETWELREPAFRCRRCGSGDVEVLAGDELTVESIEVEEVAECTARE